MTIVKVVILAVIFGFFFAVIGLLLTATFERFLRAANPFVLLNVTCVGIVLGGIAGAGQAIVDAIERKNN